MIRDSQISWELHLTCKMQVHMRPQGFMKNTYFANLIQLRFSTQSDSVRSEHTE